MAFPSLEEFVNPIGAKRFDNVKPTLASDDGILCPIENQHIALL